MNNAQTYQQWENSAHNYQAKNSVVSATGKLCRLDAKTKKSKRNPKRQKKICTQTTNTNGFLRTQFLPKIEVQEKEFNRSSKEIKHIESDFYTSLNQLAKHYNIQPITTQALVYPHNITTAFWDIQNKLKHRLKSTNNLHIIETENEQTFLSISEVYETNYCLYYVPIEPLFRIMLNKKQSEIKNILFSVFSYLYRVVGVPFYRDTETYLYWLYDMLNDWIANGEMYEEDDEDKHILLSELNHSNLMGDIVLKKIQNNKNLLFWKKRLTNFNVKTEWEKELFCIAESFYNLWQSYPNVSVFRYAKCSYHEDNLSEYLPMDKYLAFYGHSGDFLNHQIDEIINNDLSVYSEMEEPTIYKVFNGNKITQQNFDFEHQFFQLTEQLITLLHNYS